MIPQIFRLLTIYATFKEPDAQIVLAPQDAIAAAINMAFDMSRSSAKKDYFEEMKEASADRADFGNR